MYTGPTLADHEGATVAVCSPRARSRSHCWVSNSLAEARVPHAVSSLLSVCLSCYLNKVFIQVLCVLRRFCRLNVEYNDNGLHHSSVQFGIPPFGSTQCPSATNSLSDLS